MDEKQRKALSEIERALGMLEGLVYISNMRVSSAITEAVGIIDENLKEVFGDGSAHNG